MASHIVYRQGGGSVVLRWCSGVPEPHPKRARFAEPHVFSAAECLLGEEPAVSVLALARIKRDLDEFYRGRH